MYTEGRGKVFFKELAHMIIRAGKSEVCRADSNLEIQVKFHSLELQKTSILSFRFKDFNGLNEAYPHYGE